MFSACFSPLRLVPVFDWGGSEKGRGRSEGVLSAYIASILPTMSVCFLCFCFHGLILFWCCVFRLLGGARPPGLEERGGSTPKEAGARAVHQEGRRRGPATGGSMHIYPHPCPYHHPTPHAYPHPSPFFHLPIVTLIPALTATPTSTLAPNITPPNTLAPALVLQRPPLPPCPYPCVPIPVYLEPCPCP